MKNLSEVDLRSNTFKKIEEEGIYNPGMEIKTPQVTVLSYYNHYETNIDQMRVLFSGFDCNEKGLIAPAINANSLHPDVGIHIQDVSASWTDGGPITLRNINLSIPKGKLCAIIGSVGSGKVPTQT